MLTASLEDFSCSRPAWVGAPLVELAELRRPQGRVHEARELLERAGSSTRAHLCRARLALDADEAARASELAGRTLRRLPADRKLARTPALEIAVRPGSHAASCRGQRRRWRSSGRSPGWSRRARCTRRPTLRLVVSEHTVHRHMTNILRKLDLHSRTAAAAYAIRSDLDDGPGADG